MVWIIEDMRDLPMIAAQLLDYAAPRRKIAFYGAIGAGKTTFIKAICQSLGVTELVVSPTFALVNEYSYRDKQGEVKCIYHLDLYRLKNVQEALDIGIETMLEDPHYCFIEWPEVVEDLLPEAVVRIKIEAINNTARKIIIL